MKKVIGVDIYFELDTEKEGSALCEEAWEYIKKNLPECFNTEGSELFFD